METTLGRLDDAFITPLDGEDIMQLITDLYDVIEGVADVARRFSLYKVTQLYPNVRSQSDILCKVATALDELMSKLRDDKKLKELSGQLNEIHALQKQAQARLSVRCGENSPNRLQATVPSRPEPSAS